MKLNGRRESSNVDDRRGMSGMQKAGIGGIGGILIAVVVMLLSGGKSKEEMLSLSKTVKMKQTVE